jgi:hypothetical protein
LSRIPFGNKVLCVILVHFPLYVIAVWAADITLLVIELMFCLLLSIHIFILFVVVKLSFLSGYNGQYF